MNKICNNSYKNTFHLYNQNKSQILYVLKYNTLKINIINNNVICDIISVS